MPTYQYACTACGEQLEVVQRFSDEALTECPACQGALRKVFSAVGIVFKGSGFYRTDSRSAGSSSTAASPAKSDTAKSESTKSESTKSDSSTSSTSSSSAPASATAS
ncbi:putative regulatory protein, FmdB family [Sinosporangium album]|uniref:Putative regulatory protein, FmdB family n=1 Tax=Sinosporangium album TaxID=504805 RepID=A0A1G8A4Q1_9ACTN|nr:FmdB family zinc ribbon protein [Sinosporangium album]SDH15908.1 putative regulatory protein, FmdB family [Sinosporangium album]